MRSLAGCCFWQTATMKFHPVEITALKVQLSAVKSRCRCVWSSILTRDSKPASLFSSPSWFLSPWPMLPRSTARATGGGRRFSSCPFWSDSRGPAGDEKETNCLNYEREAVCSNTTTLTLSRCLVTPDKLQHFVCAYENKNLQKSFLFSTLTASRLVSASLTSLTSYSWQSRYCKVKWVNLSGLIKSCELKQKASQWRNILE